MRQWPRRVPPTEEHRGGNRGNVEHVHVFGQVVPAELHGRVFGHVTGDEFAFGFGEVEGQTVDFTGSRDAVDNERWDQRKCPPDLALGSNDLRGRHRARHEEHGNKRHTHREFV